jgi:SMI1 / KNR4 family (SUKH-1)
MTRWAVNMRFLNPEPGVSLLEVAEIEAILGIEFPPAVRSLYLSTNGGEPDPYVFENSNVDTVVAEFLPLKSERKGTAVSSYGRLVIGQGLVPRHLFPFAIDGGGDYFFVDCSTSEGSVSYYRGDSSDGERLLDLNLAFEQFWSSLKSE